MKNNFPKGSLWKKWDFHVHSPYSANYIGGIDAFEKQIIDADCDAIGINDYYSIGGYKYLLDKISSGKLNIKDKVLFPVVEMRMTDMLQNRHKGRSPKHFNFHLIFNNDEKILSIEEIEIFIKSLEADGGMIISDYSKKEKLVNKKVSLDDTLKKLNRNKKFNGNFLLLIPYNEYGGIDGIDPNFDSSAKIEYIKKAHILGSSNKKQINFFLKEKSPIGKKPCIKGSDSHDASYPIGKLRDKDSNPTNKYCWIKADLTFDGLKQIVFEPESRVKIQERKPEEERELYKIIDHINIDNDEIYNQRIDLNQNLNSIIGGRSTGKSILLSSIAKKITKNEELFGESKADYEEFITKISNSIEIQWKDNETDDKREIEFFEQGYMHELTQNHEKFNSLIQDILKRSGANELLSSFNKEKFEIKQNISSSVNEIFQIIDNIKENSMEESALGDKKSVEKEIKKLQSEKNKLNTKEITEDEISTYENCKIEIEKQTLLKNSAEADIEKVTQLKILCLFNPATIHQETEITEKNKGKILSILSSLMESTNKEWKKSLDKLIEEVKKEIKIMIENINRNKKNEIFIRISKIFAESEQIVEVEKNIASQKENLESIEKIEKKMEYFKSQKNELRLEIISFHKSYYSKMIDLLPKLSKSHKTLHIRSKAEFGEKKYTEILKDGINQKSTSNQDLSNFKFTSNDGYENHITKVFNALLNESLKLKSSFTHQRLATSLLTECFYKISYDLEYEDDNFKKMSDGKKAFVILMLLLEFSEKSCPILIDQPEDDLDNRTIFSDLVQYLKYKKTRRQIILATHNSNIVVGSDSENVIVANQDGIESPNKNKKRFKYITGSLENTRPVDKINGDILDLTSIREHVCAILEGGGEAFKLREMKYGNSLLTKSPIE